MNWKTKPVAVGAVVLALAVGAVVFALATRAGTARQTPPRDKANAPAVLTTPSSPTVTVTQHPVARPAPASKRQRPSSDDQAGDRSSGDSFGDDQAGDNNSGDRSGDNQAGDSSSGGSSGDDQA